jgi:hypothetical protein
MNRRRALCLLIFVMLGSLALAAFSATAAVIPVTTTANDGPGSLREALLNASDGDTVEIQVEGNISLFDPLPNLSKVITIDGPGADRLSISPAPASNAVASTAFSVDFGTVVSINSLTVTGFNHAVENHGTLSVAKCNFTRNHGGFGPLDQYGGIYNDGTLNVNQSTISNNTAVGLADGRGGGIANLGALSVVNSTISGNVAKGANGVDGLFLTKHNSDVATDADSQNYYQIVDPNGTRQTLGDWWAANGFSAIDGSAPGEAKAAYLNNNDLAFGRDMHILAVGSKVGSYVANYSIDPLGPDQNPLSADAANAKDPVRALATVCMEYSPIENDPQQRATVKFFVYNGVSSTATRIGGVDLDGNGKKFTPQLCTVCHGGLLPALSQGVTPGLEDIVNMGSHFREFDIASFKFSRPGTFVDDPSRSIPTTDEEAAFKRLNQLVLAANPSPAMQELIEGWYGGPGLPSPVQDTGFVPSGWNNPGDARVAQLYRDVISTSCRTCHVAQSIDFRTYDSFKLFRSVIAAEVLSNPAKVMPNAKVTFFNFWREGRQFALADFEGPDWTPIGTDSIFGSSGGGASGGGIYTTIGTANIVNSTIVLNRAVAGVGVANQPDAVGGGGFLTSNPPSFTTLSNDIVANNFNFDVRAFGSQDVSADAFFSSGGFNLFGHADVEVLLSDLVNIADPQISALAFNGGPTETHTLLPGSPAIEHGGPATDPVTGDPISTDQRGLLRPVDDPLIAPADGGNNSDIGAVEVQSALFLNISTRLAVEKGDNVLIGGFIITGSPKTVLLRAIGPSLGEFGISNPLPDPVLELHEPNGIIITNDNWRDSQEQEITDTGIPPSDDRESAILGTFEPGAYTAIVRGNDDTTGVALVEAYGIDGGMDGQLANISTRGLVQTGDNVLIGGVILGPDQTVTASVVVRAIGPSLVDQGISDPLQDPTLELHDSNGDVISSNDDWTDSPDKQFIIDKGLAPPDTRESAAVLFAAPGAFTAVVRGKGDTTGVALVEAYNVSP